MRLLDEAGATLVGPRCGPEASPIAECSSFGSPSPSNPKPNNVLESIEEPNVSGFLEEPKVLVVWFWNPWSLRGRQSHPERSPLEPPIHCWTCMLPVPPPMVPMLPMVSADAACGWAPRRSSPWTSPAGAADAACGWAPRRGSP